MTSKATAAFLAAMEDLEQDLASRLKELKEIAIRENPAVSRRPVKLSWFDELSNIEETITTQMEFSRSAARLDVLVATSESAADALEAALFRAEDLANARHGYISEIPKVIATDVAVTKNERFIANLASREAPRDSALELKAEDERPKYLREVSVNTPALAKKTPKASRFHSFQEPPTPKLEDLGLSAATLNLLRRKN